MFALSLFLGSFGLNVSAASDNLISSDLTTWTDFSELQENSFPVTVKEYGGKYYRVQLSDQDYSVYFGAILDHTSLVAGHSYSLSFNLPDEAEINSALGTSFSSTSFDNNFKNSTLYIGIAFISPSGVVNMPDDYLIYNIDKTNYEDFLGKQLKSSFVASNYSGTPCVVIEIASLDGEGHYFYFSDFALVDNDDNSAELTGIRGFLHSIRWDLIGGVCGEEDCPHSSADNPHLSLTERMSTGFASMFEAIGNKFEEGSTLNVWFNNLSNTVGNLDGSLSNLGSDIGSFFSDLKTNMSTWFSELDDSVTTKFQEIGDRFTEFFDKFKPRVQFNLEWKSNYYVSVNNGNLFHKTDGYTGNAVVTDFFEVSSGSKYLIDYSKLSNTTLHIFKYQLDDTFVSIEYKGSTFTEYELEPGYKYRFQIYGHTGTDFTVIEDLSEYCNSYVKVYADEGWINALLYNLKMGLKGLFVPDEQFIATWKEELELLLEERLGIIYDAGDFFISLIQTIGDLLTTTADDIHYELPAMEIELNGTTYVLWKAQQVDFSFLKKNAFFSMLYNLYKVIINVFLGIPLLNYAKKEFDNTLHN